MRELYINEIKGVTSYGNSHPIIVKAEDNNTYVLKTRADGTLADKVDFGIFIETLSYKLLQKFGFKNIPVIEYLIIDDDFLQDAEFLFGDSKNEREQVALANIKASKGLNLGVKWIENSEKFIDEDLSRDFKKETINYDGYIMNSDRNKSNPNILYCKDDRKKYLIDFGGAFEMLMAFYIMESDTALFEIPKFYNKFCFDNDYLLLDEVDGVTTIKNKITKDEIDELIDELPREWEPHKLKDEIAYIISQRVGNKEIFKQ
ncbi:MAG: HipA family kinase [Campylobacterota bacterium]